MAEEKNENSCDYFLEYLRAKKQNRKGNGVSKVELKEPVRRRGVTAEK